MELLSRKAPPEKRRAKCDHDDEWHLTEAAVMLAMAEWLFQSGAASVSMHPDGMHLKAFDVRSYLQHRGFRKVEDRGRTCHGGTYRKYRNELEVHPQSGLGDVVCRLDGQTVEIEAKGGCLNTRHSGQVSKLRKHLHEAIGQLMSSPRKADRMIAAVPDHPETRKVAKRAMSQCPVVGIEIALVAATGEVTLMTEHL